MKTVISALIALAVLAGVAAAAGARPYGKTDAKQLFERLDRHKY